MDADETAAGARWTRAHDFHGRVAIVTGASRGIGKAIAEMILRGGGSVCLTARRQPELDATLAELGAGDRAIAAMGASDDPEHRRATVARVLEVYGSLDILVNNAASNPLHGPLIAADPVAMRKILDVNVIAPLAWVREAWAGWMADHGGSVLNVASVSGVAVEPSLGAYGASKAALIHLTRQLALELSPGVRVNAVAPAVVRTRFARPLYENREEEVARNYPLARLGLPRDVAAVARLLLGDEGSWITGQTFVLDGGITLTSAIATPPMSVTTPRYPPEAGS